MSGSNIHNMDSSSPSMGRFGSKHFDELETEEQLRFGLETLCMSPASSSNSVTLSIEEPNPRMAWKLPQLSASDVYSNLSAFQLKALSHIKIRENSIRTELNLNTMMTVPLLEPKHIQAAIKSGYKYVHLGMVRIGLNALHRKGQPTFVFSALFDNRWTSFTQALIGGIETTMSDGPVQYDVCPDFSVALNDPNILNCLT